MADKCTTCGGVLEAKPVDTSQFPSGSLQPVADACSCTSTQSTSLSQQMGCPTQCTPKCPPISCVSACEEDHTKEVTINNFSAVVKTSCAFNFPAVGAQAEVQLVNVISLIPGQILWAQGIGRLHVVSYDALTRKVVLTNLGDSCTDNPAAAGELIPSCTEFAVGIPECNSGGAGSAITAGPFLAADLTSPGNGNCTTVKVTTIVGLAVNDIVSIATFQYRIDQIIDTETIVLCDDGDGAPLGQVIEWDANCDDVPDVPILPISGDNPCSKAPVASGVLVVCVNGQQVILNGSQTGQVPVWDEEQGKFVLVNFNLNEQCTFLTACFTVDIGDDGPYLVTVNDTSLFVVGQQVRIDGDLFTIDSIEDATHMRLIPDTTPVAIKEYDEGEQVCLRDCCEFLPQQVERIGELILISPNINLQSNKFNIEAGMVDRYYVNSDNDIALALHTNNSSFRQFVELDLSISQGVTLNGGNVALSELQVGINQPSVDNNSLQPRALAYFDSNNVGAGAPPAGFYNTDSGVTPLNISSQGVIRGEFLDPGETVEFVGRHMIAFGNTGGNNPPANGTNHHLFIHGRIKVFRAAV